VCVGKQLETVYSGDDNDVVVMMIIKMRKRMRMKR
jgi:hypothetical protein